MLEGRGGIDERAVEVEQRRDHRSQLEASRSTRLLVAVNGRARKRRIRRPRPGAAGRARGGRRARRGRGDRVRGRAWGCCGVRRPSAAACVVLAGGTGRCTRPRTRRCAAARAGARACRGGPTTSPARWAPACGRRRSRWRLPGRRVRSTRCAWPPRSFRVRARSAQRRLPGRGAVGLPGRQLSDLRQGVRALLGALRRFRPYATALRLDDGELSSRPSAQILLSNLPYFGLASR